MTLTNDVPHTVSQGESGVSDFLRPPLLPVFP